MSIRGKTAVVGIGETPTDRLGGKPGEAKVLWLQEGGVDLGPGARGHVRVAVDDVGDGLHRDPGPVGDVDEPGETRLPPLGGRRRPGRPRSRLGGHRAEGSAGRPVGHRDRSVT